MLLHNQTPLKVSLRGDYCLNFPQSGFSQSSICGTRRPTTESDTRLIHLIGLLESETYVGSVPLLCFASYFQPFNQFTYESVSHSSSLAPGFFQTLGWPRSHLSTNEHPCAWLPALRVVNIREFLRGKVTCGVGGQSACGQIVRQEGATKSKTKSPGMVVFRQHFFNTKSTYLHTQWL